MSIPGGVPHEPMLAAVFIDDFGDWPDALIAPVVSSWPSAYFWDEANWSMSPVDPEPDVIVEGGK